MNWRRIFVVCFLTLLVGSGIFISSMEAQQTCSESDTVRIVRQGGALWHVVVDGDTVSSHTSQAIAVTKGTVLHLLNLLSGKSVSIQQTFIGKFQGCFPRILLPTDSLEVVEIPIDTGVVIPPVEEPAPDVPPTDTLLLHAVASATITCSPISACLFDATTSVADSVHWIDIVSGGIISTEISSFRDKVGFGSSTDPNEPRVRTWGVVAFLGLTTDTIAIRWVVPVQSVTVYTETPIGDVPANTTEEGDTPANTTPPIVPTPLPPTAPWVPGPGLNEPLGMEQVVDQRFQSPIPKFPIFDSQGFSLVNGGHLTVVDDNGVNVLRGTVPKDWPQNGTSMWSFESGRNFPQNTGKLYSRQRIRFSPNYRMDSSVGSKFWRPTHTQTVSGISNNFISIVRGMAGNPPAGDQKAVAPLGQEQSMSWQFGTQTGPPNGSLNREQSTFSRMFSNNAQWHELEILLIPKLPSGNADGEILVWLDGQLMWHDTKVTFNNPGDNNHIGNLWTFFQYNPTVGMNSHVNTVDASGLPGRGWQDQWFDYGYWYVSVEKVSP